ncbi:MAG: hypothetical protein OEZ59_12815 [Deltaproteobacteria bacterium]|nr:hypothetical protein [Deltaproteobacteria bacterium]
MSMNPFLEYESPTGAGRSRSFRMPPALLAAVLLTGLLAFATAAPVQAEEVEAEGVAAVLNNNVSSARKQALLNAKRNAVEQGVGLLLDSKTFSSNFEIIQDQVLSSSQGFVKKFKVLSEGLTPDKQNFKVRIRATVEDTLLKDRLSALRLLHKQMGNRRVMVVYFTENPNAMDRTHGASRSALQTLRHEFNQAGFRMFNEEATNNVYKMLERGAGAKGPVDDLLAMALEQKADILVRFDNVAGKKAATGGMFSAARSTIRVSAFDTATGRQMADSQAEAKVLLKADAGPYDWEKGLSDASGKAAQQAATEAINRIGEYYKQLGDTGVAFLLGFKGFNDDEKDLILDYLENTPGFQHLSELKNSVDYLEIELFSSEDSSRLRRMIRAGLKDKGIVLQTLSSDRNRIMFSNAKTQ